MRYAIRTVAGLGLLVAGLTSISCAVYHMLQVGTCASGGPYEIARECPDGTVAVGLSIPISVLVMFAGLAIHYTRGAPPGPSRSDDGISGIAILWTGLFFGIAFACFWGVWGPNANPGPGAETGGLIIGFTFIPLGLGGLYLFGSTARAARQSAPEVLGPSSPRGSLGDLMATMERQERSGAVSGAHGATVAGGGDRIAKLERLQRLREAGTIDDAEFERLKREVMAE